MADVLTHDILILGAGLAGLRAAVEVARVSKGEVDIGIISKNQLNRAHSVAAEGGSAAVLRTEDGDSLQLHAWDTVKGSDFLADQDAVHLFVNAAPKEILQLDHWGIPWTRRDDGRIAQRPFGGHSYPRAVLAADKTGFFEMQTLYDTLLKYTNFTRYDEWFITSIVVENGEYKGLTAIDMSTGKFVFMRSKALIIATGGAGTLYGFTTYSHTASSFSCVAKRLSSQPAVPVLFMVSQHILTLLPVMVWQWRIVRVYRWRTWSSCSFILPGLCLPGFSSPKLVGEREVTFAMLKVIDSWKNMHRIKKNCPRGI